MDDSFRIVLLFYKVSLLLKYNISLIVVTCIIIKLMLNVRSEDA